MKKFVFIMPFMAIALLANCGGKTYHVKFTNGNELVTEKDYKENETIVAPADPAVPVKEHQIYTFDGWWDNDVKYEEGMKATQNYTFDAQFSSVEAYEMNFYNNEEKTELFKNIKIPSDNPVLTFPEHEVTAGYVGEWWCEEESISYLPGEEGEFSSDCNFVWKEKLVKQYMMKFYNDEAKEDLCIEIPVSELSPIFTTPKHDVKIAERLGQWRYDFEIYPTYVVSYYVSPEEELDLADILQQLELLQLDHLDFIWSELIQYKATFKDASGATIQKDEISFTVADYSFTFPAGPDEQENYKWYNADEDKYYDPGTDFVFINILEPSGHAYDNYEFIWKEREIPTQDFLLTFYKSDGTTQWVQLTITATERTIKAPSAPVPAEQETHQWVCSQQQFFCFAADTDAVEVPLELLMDIGNLDFVWTQNPLL